VSRTTLFSCGVLSLAASLVTERADAEPRVSVALKGCAALQSEPIEKLIALDLRDEPIEGVDADITCSEQSIDVAVDVLPGGQRYQRALSPRLLDQPGAERTLAVTLSQMVLAERFQLEAPELEPPVELPAPKPPVPAPMASTIPSKPRADHGLRIDANLSALRRGTHVASTSRALSAGVSLSLSRRVALELRAGYESGLAERALGSVAMRAAWLEMGPQLKASRGLLNLRVAASAGAGWASLEGRAGSQASASDVSGVVAQGKLSVTPALTLGPVLVLLRAALGYGLPTVRARVRGEPDVTPAGALFELGAGVGFDFAP